MTKKCCVLDSSGKRVGCFDNARDAAALRMILAKDTGLGVACSRSGMSGLGARRRRRSKRK